MSNVIFYSFLLWQYGQHVVFLEKTTVLCYLRISKIKEAYRESRNERTGQSRKSPS